MTRRDYVVVGSAPVPGAEPAYAKIIAGADVVIAADGGIKVCLAADRMPDLLVGDFDSVSADTLERANDAGVRIMRFPAEKDESDLDLALAVARAEGAERVTFTASFTGRADHTLAAFGTLLRSADLHGEIAEPDWYGYALDARSRCSLELEEAQGTVLSVIGYSGAAEVSISGVRYPLSRHVVEPLSSLGLSNVATADRQLIEVHAGAVVVIVNRGMS